MGRGDRISGRSCKDVAYDEACRNLASAESSHIVYNPGLYKAVEHKYLERSKRKNPFELFGYWINRIDKGKHQIKEVEK